jgi:hypothetical protein
MPITHQFMPEHGEYLLKQCKRIPDKNLEFRQKLERALRNDDVQEYLKVFTTKNPTPFMPCALCAAPTTNEVSSTCVSCQEAADILQRTLSTCSKVWSATIEGGKVLDSLSHLASLHDRRNIYCPDCRGLLWSAAPYKTHHFEHCPHVQQSREA